MAVTEKHLTEEQFMRMPDDGRKYEFVDGEAKEVPTGARHEDIGMNLTDLLLGAGARKHGRLLGSSAGFRMVDGNIRSPDISYVSRERLPGGVAPVEMLDGAPDLAVEILSPGEDRADSFRKIIEYFDSGARMVWVIQPAMKTVTVYTSLDDVNTYGPDDEITGGDLLPDFRCRVSQIFATG